MEQHDPNGQEPHPPWHDTRNLFWRNDVYAKNSAK